MTAPPAGAASGWTPSSGERTRLVLVRHGSTVHSKAMRFSGRNDLALDAAGEKQVAAVAAALATHPFGTVTAVVSSPLRRTRQTAGAIAGALGLDVRTDDDLAETDFGEWEGRTIAELPEAELETWRASLDATPPGGESFAAVGLRAQRAREAAVAAHPGEVVVVVSHVTPIKSLVRAVLDAPPVAFFRMHLDTASVSVIDYFADGGASLRVFNDTSHLR